MQVWYVMYLHILIDDVTISVMRKPVYFQYEMNCAESVLKVIDSLMNDWAQIVHLYCLIEDMAEYLRLGKK